MAGGSRNHTSSPTKRRVHAKHKRKAVDPSEASPPPVSVPGLHTLHTGPSITAPVERCISAILKRRFHDDIARLYSTHLVRVCQNSLPALMLDIVLLTGPGWMAANASSETIKAYLRGPIAMDLRQAEERVATKSLLWSYTAIRYFAMSRGVVILPNKGVHSESLLPHLESLESYLGTLDATPGPYFARPPVLGPLSPNLEFVERQCMNFVKKMVRAQVPKTPGKQYDSYIESITNKKGDECDERLLPSEWRDWRLKLRVGCDSLIETVWEVANEFNPAGFGSLLRGKLEDRWCDCGCSTDSLADVCEPAIREDEEGGDHRSRAGKGREWDGRGSGINGWNSESEEDAWTLKLDFGSEGPTTNKKTAIEALEQRYIAAEKEKDKACHSNRSRSHHSSSNNPQGNKAFKEARFEDAVLHYSAAHQHEPEMSHYQLNLAAAHLKLSDWIAAEVACTKSLCLQKSQKGFWRRCKARQELGKFSEAIQDAKAILQLAPDNEEARLELTKLQKRGAKGAKGAPPLQRAKRDTVLDPPVASGSQPQKTGKNKGNTPLPFALHDVDFTRLRIAPSRKTFDVPGKQQKDTLPYPTWESYDLQLES